MHRFVPFLISFAWLGFTFAYRPLYADESPTKGAWQSQKLSPLFFGEGGTIADLDGDKHADVIAGPKVFFGPDFQTSIDLVETKPFSIIGYSKYFFAFDCDIDKDADLDVVIIGFPGEATHWYRNPGHQLARKGPWERFVMLDVVDNESPTFTDLTGDGIPELVCCNGEKYGYASVPSDPTSKWAFVPISDSGKYQRFTHGLGVGDVNDDGRNDVICKDGWWEQPKKLDAAPWPYHAYAFSGPGGAQMIAVDLDGDKRTDIVTSLAAHGYGLSVYKKKLPDQATEWERIDIMTEKPETSPTGLAISQLHALDVADMDGDSKPDIIAGKRFWAHNGSDRGENEPPLLVWFKPVASPSGLRFVPNLIDDNSGVGTQIVARDANSDGRLDVISVSKRGIHLLTQSATKPPDIPSRPTASLAIPISDSIGGFRVAWSESDAMNLDFEKGDLRDWTATGAAFFNQPIHGDTVAARRNDSKSEHHAQHWIGTYEVTGDIAFGTLTSTPFRLTKPWVSYLQGGGSGPETRVEIVDAANQKVIAQTVGADMENMKRATLHLERAVGRDVFVRLVDNAKEGWGHINFDDFRIHDSEPNIPKEQRLPVLDKISYQSLPAKDAADAMTIPYGFSVQVIASEPDVRQPVAMTIDHRGRVWVAEAYQYPKRADGDEGKDRVLIFEDTDKNGTLDSRKVFADKLNLISGIEVGFGGLWVGAAPYLLFIPDNDGDDIPDGPPVQKLAGWGYQDTHETLNSFIWGPDGWLYGCHGVFTHSEVRVLKADGTATSDPPTRINAGIWRYHPPSEKFEVFAHGTSNPWGVDFNEVGDAFLTACVIPHLYHVIPNARYQRQAGQHFNPYTYNDIQTIALHRHWIGDTPHSGNNRSDSAGGGHAHSGAMIYQGGSWPKQYHNQLFMNNIHGARLNQDKLERRGSGYVGDRAPDFLLANDASSQILYFRSGPDGQVIAIDWYDAQQCHINDPAKHDQSNGRIYRISYRDAQPVQVDLSKESDIKLAQHQSSTNDWFARTSRRLLMERTQSRALQNDSILELRRLLKSESAVDQLRAAWTLAACSLLEAIDLQRMLQSKNAHVRGWAVRLNAQSSTAMKQGQASIALEQLIQLASSDPSSLVRLELASACQTLEVTQAASILRKLIVHVEDESDHNLPLMLWYAVSRCIEKDPAIIQDWLKINRIPIIDEYIAKQASQSWLASGRQSQFESFARILEELAHQADASRTSRTLSGLLQGLEGKRTVSVPNLPPLQAIPASIHDWKGVPAPLLTHKDSVVRGLATQIAVKLSDPKAIQILISRLQDANASNEERIQSLNTLKQVKASGLSDIAFRLLDTPELRAAAVSAVADTLDSSNASRLMQTAMQWPSVDDRRIAWYAMLRRASTSEMLLASIRDKQLTAQELTADMVQQIQRHNSESLLKTVADIWGTVRALDEDKQKGIAMIRKLVDRKSEPDQIERGKLVYKRVCGQCHTLFGQGGKIGPELTGSNRRDLNYLLENIMDPSAVMAKEYQPWIVQTKDDQVITGLMKESNANSIKLQTATEEIVVYTNEIEAKKQSKQSMMPSDLLSPLAEGEIRDLFAYLRSN